MNRKKWLVIVMAAAMVAGMAGTVRDWREWYRAETDKFGQGYEDSRAPALPLTAMAHNQLAGLRIKYPGVWKEEKMMSEAKTGETREQAWGWEKDRKVVSWNNNQVTVWVRLSRINLPDVINGDIEKLNQEGIKLAKERENTETQTCNWEMITYEEMREVPYMVQKAYCRKDERILIIQTEVKSENWGQIEKTIKAIYEETVVI